MLRSGPRLQAILRSLKPNTASSFHTSAGLAMRAVIYDKTGDSSVLHVGDVPKPKIGPSDALVKVDYAGPLHLQLQRPTNGDGGPFMIEYPVTNAVA